MFIFGQIHKKLYEMKKVLIVILSVALFACTQQTGFKINVNLEGAEGQILLEERDMTGWVAVDTAEIVDGVAILKGETKYPKAYYLSMLGERNKAIIFVENNSMTVKGKIASIDSIEVTGSVTHNDYEKISKELEPLVESYMEPYRKSRELSASGDTAKAKELMEQVQKLYEASAQQMKDIQVNFIKENPGSYYAPVVLNNVYRELEIEKLDEIVIGLDAKLDSIPSIVNLKERLEVLKTVAVGQIAPDFTQNDPDGNPVKFSDIYKQNELTLLDFWASWCGPCRTENPNVVEVYHTYKDKGFTVFGVSFDKEREKWLQAIEDDGLVWKQVSMVKGWDNEARALYAVNGIPHSLLVDKTGKIIARDKRDKELGEAVAEFFDK